MWLATCTQRLADTAAADPKLVDLDHRALPLPFTPRRWRNHCASRVALTTAGKRRLTAALKTYEAEVASILGGVLTPEEQQQMSDYVSRLLTSIDQGEGT